MKIEVTIDAKRFDSLAELARVLESIPGKALRQIHRPPASCTAPESCDQLRRLDGTVVGTITVTIDRAPESPQPCPCGCAAEGTCGCEVQLGLRSEPPKPTTDDRTAWSRYLNSAPVNAAKCVRMVKRDGWWLAERASDGLCFAMPLGRFSNVPRWVHENMAAAFAERHNMEWTVKQFGLTIIPDHIASPNHRPTPDAATLGRSDAPGVPVGVPGAPTPQNQSPGGSTLPG